MIKLSKKINIGTALLDFIRGTHFAQICFDHSESYRCENCEGLSTSIFNARVSILKFAYKRIKFNPTLDELREALEWADIAQDTFASSGDFADAARSAGIRRSIDSWIRLAESSGYKVSYKNSTYAITEGE